MQNYQSGLPQPAQNLPVPTGVPQLGQNFLVNGAGVAAAFGAAAAAAVTVAAVPTVAAAFI